MKTFEIYKNAVYCYYFVKYEDKEKAKANGLRWEPESKLWVKRVEYLNHDELFLLSIPTDLSIHHFSSFMVPSHKVEHLEKLARDYQKQVFKSKSEGKKV